MERLLQNLPSPCYAVDKEKLISNLEVLQSVSKLTGCKILLAQKAFAMHSVYPLIRRYLCGTAASGLFEARLGAEMFGGETHVYSPAYKDEDIDELTSLCGYIIFNSFEQWRRFGGKALAAGCSCGLRINPECSTQRHAIYDPCSKGSRLGITRGNFKEELCGIEGLHMHTLCEQNADALVTTLRAAEDKFGNFFSRMKWLNIGGGHHITREDYDIETLVRQLIRIRDKYDVQVYIEPGEAVALNAGYLLCSVLDTVQSGVITTALLDTSAACHMPDVIEMPYRPEILGAALPGEKAYTYRLAGPTCLAGDIIGDYSFDTPLKSGDKLVFLDMAHYTMVKNNTFNGMPLPAIALIAKGGKTKVIRTFGYDDFKERLS